MYKSTDIKLGNNKPSKYRVWKFFQPLLKKFDLVWISKETSDSWAEYADRKYKSYGRLQKMYDNSQVFIEKLKRTQIANQKNILNITQDNYDDIRGTKPVHDRYIEQLEFHTRNLEFINKDLKEKNDACNKRQADALIQIKGLEQKVYGTVSDKAERFIETLKKDNYALRKEMNGMHKELELLRKYATNMTRNGVR